MFGFRSNHIIDSHVDFRSIIIVDSEWILSSETISARKFLIQITSVERRDRAMHSASAVERATAGYFLHFHEISSVEPTNNT